MMKEKFNMKYVLLLLSLLSMSCVSEDKIKSTQIGIVSHYSIRTNSPRNSTITASGIPLNDSLRTAAHKTLPFNTRVRVIREDNPKLQTIVVITDRGPYIAGRILDVSQAAAKDLQMITKGIIKCKLEILD